MKVLSVPIDLGKTIYARAAVRKGGNAVSGDFLPGKSRKVRYNGDFSRKNVEMLFSDGIGESPGAAFLLFFRG